MTSQKLESKGCIRYEEFDYKNNHIVMFIIPAAVGETYNFKNEAHVRIGSNLTKLKDFPEYLRRIYSSQMDWSAQIIENADISDLDTDAIAKARQLYVRKHEHLREEIENWDDITFLNKARITIKGQINKYCCLTAW